MTIISLASLQSKGFCSVCSALIISCVPTFIVSVEAALRASQCMHALLTNPEVLNTVPMYTLIGIFNWTAVMQ